MSKEEKSRQLHRAVGLLDDSLLQEALAYAPAKTLHLRRRRSLVISLVAALVAVVALLGTFVGLRLARKNREVLLGALPAEKKAASYAVSAPDYFSGQLQIIWRYEGSDRLYCKRVTADQVKQLLSAQSTAERVGEEQSSETVRLWVCDEFGNVTTPFLSSSQGNTAFGTVFDYEPEWTVTKETGEFLESLFT